MSTDGFGYTPAVELDSQLPCSWIPGSARFAPPRNDLGTGLPITI